MAMTASLSIIGNPIANQSSTCLLTVSNSGASAVNVTGVALKATPINQSIKFGPIFAAPGISVAGSNGNNQMSVAVSASGSVTFSFSVIGYSAGVQTNPLSQGSLSSSISADIISDDGSMFSPIAVAFSPALPQAGQLSAVNNAAQLQFNNRGNSAFIF